MSWTHKEGLPVSKTRTHLTGTQCPGHNDPDTEAVDTTLSSQSAPPPVKYSTVPYRQSHCFSFPGPCRTNRTVATITEKIDGQKCFDLGKVLLNMLFFIISIGIHIAPPTFKA